MNEESLQQLRLQKNSEAKGVLHFFDKVINCPKNILIFLPIYYETIDKSLLVEEQSEIIFNELSDTLKYIYEFRKEHQPNLKTYLVYLEKLQKDCTNFVISEFTEYGLAYIDSVDMFSLKTVLRIKIQNTIF